MSELAHTSETPAADTETSPAEQPTGTQPPVEATEAKPTETVDYWKRMSRQNEAQAKANADAARRLKEIEDRDLSELQKAQRDRDELASRYADLERNALRSNVALAKGLPPEVAAILAGSTEEELTAHADALLAWRGATPPPIPRPDPGQGPRPGTPESDAEAEYKRFFPNG
jgi:hypothetical protein